VPFDKKAVEAAIAALAPELQTVLRLALQNVTYEEMAVATGLSVHTVKERLHRARLMVKRQLSDGA
jgi:DNA-directed RNA polymerase specialized sigma24 family protein